MFDFLNDPKLFERLGERAEQIKIRAQRTQVSEQEIIDSDLEKLQNRIKANAAGVEAHNKKTESSENCNKTYEYREFREEKPIPQILCLERAPAEV
ncbi:MAG: hypothetical protein FWG90_11670 [Oscillospiraceae bacterium]|nr:hypothetical protein [Oscillospiraceae bacterium]